MPINLTKNRLQEFVDALVKAGGSAGNDRGRDAHC